MKDRIFIGQLIRIGYTSNEAEVYHHLIKHGPKTVAALSRNIHTYREQTYRTLVSLQSKGSVNLKLSERGVYAAVPVEEALEIQLHRDELLLREKKQFMQEILEAAEGLNSEPLGTSCKFQLHHTLSEIGAHSLRIINSAKHEVLVVIPPELLHSTMRVVQTAIIDAAKRGVSVRGITDSITCLKAKEKNLKICSFGTYDGICFLSVDTSESITFIHWEKPGRVHYKTVSAFYCDDPSYATHLKFIFNVMWIRLADTKKGQKLQTV